MARNEKQPAHVQLAAVHGKIPPQAIDVEEIVLGALIIEGKSIIDVADILIPESFYRDAHVRIYSAIQSLFRNSEPIDMATVINKLRKSEELELVGGAPYVMGLTMKVNSAANLEHHARIISEAFIKRELIKVCMQIQVDAYNDSSDAFLLLDNIEQQVFNLAQRNTKRNYVTMGKAINAALVEMDNKKATDSSITGVPSGFPKQDSLTAGFQKGELYIVAGRPGAGKSVYATSIARNAAVEFNSGVALFLLEMSTNQVTNRMISAETGIEGDKIRRGQLSVGEWEKLHKTIGPLSSAKIFLDDTPDLSLLELRAKCRRLKAEHDIQMIVIDYLQLMSNAINGKSSGTREQEIAQISRGLKNLAKDLDVPVIALSQLSRSVESRGGDKRPMLADLRESGSLEQDSDVVMFLYRPEYYGILEDESGNSLLGVGEVIVAKNRGGSLGTVKLHFSGKFSKFENPDSPFTQPEIPFTPAVSLDTPVTSFIPAKQNSIFDITPPTEDAF